MDLADFIKIFGIYMSLYGLKRCFFLIEKKILFLGHMTHETATNYALSKFLSLSGIFYLELKPKWNTFKLSHMPFHHHYAVTLKVTDWVLWCTIFDSNWCWFWYHNSQESPIKIIYHSININTHTPNAATLSSVYYSKVKNMKMFLSKHVHFISTFVCLFICFFLIPVLFSILKLKYI